MAELERRALGKSGLTVSEIGLGCEHMQGKDFETVEAVIDEAIAQGIDVMDVFMSEPDVRSNIGRALEGRREKMQIQGHIGSAWLNGQYSRTRKLDECKYFFEDFLTRLRTDYVDIGMLHYVDAQPDYERMLQSGMAEYAAELKRQGVIRAVGMSSHDPAVALQAVESGIIDVLMFSINPAFDILPEDTDIEGLMSPDSFLQEGIGGVEPSRERLYRACEAHGVGITVMKTYAAGALLSDAASPFGKALTPAQCIHYALTRPAAASVLIGCKTREEVRAAVAYEDANARERDYAAVLGGARLFSMKGRCMYCNHCLPCPSHIDVAQVNKFLDLANMAEDGAPASVKEHYLALERHASDCIGCKSCERNCPFDVPVVERMAEAARLFGK